MAFLRRLLGGTGRATEDEAPAGPAGNEGAQPEDEAAREREILRAEAKRLDDELIQRQLRYADRSWVPPRQGGERRAGEGEGGGDEG
jgi:hypothetical protein